MREFHWLTEAIAKEIHSQLIEQYGGKTGILHLLKLKATLDRPLNLFNYKPESTLFDLAASYGYGLIKNHCFVDGNKRMGLAAIDVFLRINGHQLRAEESAIVSLILEVAASRHTSEEEEVNLASWLETNSSLTLQ